MSFYKGKFFDVWFTCEGDYNKVRLLEILKEVLGEETMGVSEMHAWKSEKTITLYIVQKNKLALVWMTSDSLRQLMSEEEKAKLKKEAMEF
ncbi:MAG: hypothetical protein ABSE41_02100 [Bacteroidota bacterium]